VVDFYLGADVSGFKWDLPVMVSHGRLRGMRVLPRATAPWICDSRGFSELSQHGKWTITPRVYADALDRYATEIGRMEWSAPQDWMCEDWILAKTGKTVADHHELTCESVAEQRQLATVERRVIPVLQGQTLADYLRHWEMYSRYGIDLLAEPVVGLGSVCRRQATTPILEIVTMLASHGLQLHGFGIKTSGIDTYGALLASADSFAWSYGARRRVGHCPHGVVKWEANCPIYAREWRDGVVGKVSDYAQYYLI
jgi:hypothetical protein